MLMANIVFLGGISGGHFNPAVTMGVLIKEGRANFGQNIVFAIMIWIAEILGAVLGVFCVFMTNKTVYTDSEKLIYPGIALLCPGISDTKQSEHMHCEGH